MTSQTSTGQLTSVPPKVFLQGGRDSLGREIREHVSAYGAREGIVGMNLGRIHEIEMVYSR